MHTIPSSRRLINILLQLLLAAFIAIIINTLFPQTRGVTGPLNAWQCTLLMAQSIFMLVHTLARRRAMASQSDKEHPR